MMSVSINMVLNAKNRYNFGKIKVGLMKEILMVGSSGILDKLVKRKKRQD